MLVRFICENFLSFGSEFDFVNIASINRKTELKGHIVQNSEKDFAILKGSGIYGANASGKSNFLEALKFSRDLIFDMGIVREKLKFDNHASFMYSNYKISDCFNKFSKSKEIKFEYYIKLGNKIYNYGFVVSLKKNKKDKIELIEEDAETFDSLSFIVKDEWLYETSLNKNSEKEKPIFERKEMNIMNDDELKKIVEKEKDEKFYEYTKKAVLENQLFLNRLFTDNIEFAIKFKDWFESMKFYEFRTKISRNIDRLSFLNNKFRFLENKDLFNFTKKILQIVDKQIEDVEISKNRRKDEPSNIKISIIRNKEKFDLRMESDGIQNIFKLIPILYSMKNRNSIYVIDEIEQSLHPLIAKLFIKLFYIVTKDNESQLIFTTHNSSLMDLDLMNRDEIWITEKDEKLNTKMKSLAEFKIRKDLVINKGYLENRFGGIPDVNFKNLEEIL